MILVKDLFAAEERFLAAEREHRNFQTNPDQWSAFETVDRQGRKHLHFTEAQFDRQAALEAKVVEQRAALLALRKAYIEGV